jgi:hypothetical protein
MDKEMIVRHLAKAERAVALGQKHIAEQRAIIEQLSRSGRNMGQAEQLLLTFVETQRVHVEHLDRVRKELSEATHT